MRKGIISLSVALALSSVLSGAAVAAPYEEGDKVTVIIGFKPGGGADRLAQLIEPFLTKETGLKFINQYVPGASGAIAWTKVANIDGSKGDTISITQSPSMIAAYMFSKSINYSYKDFLPLANVVTDPGILVVGKDSPYNSLEDIIKAAKENPNHINVGTSGVGGGDHLSLLFLGDEAGVKFKAIPFKGDGPANTAAMGGKVDAASSNLAITYAQIKAGNLKPLAIYADKRSDKLPDVPTLKELGYNTSSGSSRGFSTPKGFPQDKLEFLRAAFEKVLKNPDFLAEADRQAQIIDPHLGKDYDAIFAEYENRLSPHVEKFLK